MKKKMVTVLALALMFSSADARKRHGSKEHRNGANWETWGRDLGNSNFARKEKKINRCNVGDLKVKWSLEHLSACPDANNPGIGAVIRYPLIRDGIVYFVGLEREAVIEDGECENGDAVAYAYARKACSGREVWTTRLIIEGQGQSQGRYVTGAALGEEFTYVCGNNRSAQLIALRLSDGEQVADIKFGNEPGEPRQALFGPPQIVPGAGPCGQELILVGLQPRDPGLPAAVLALTFDGTEFNIVWRFDLDLFGGDGASVYTELAVDTCRGLVYFGTGQARSVVNPLSDSLVAVRLSDGSYVWHRQFTLDDTGESGDTMDWDAVSGPMLMSPKISGNCTDIVVIGDKKGFIYALDRDSGALIWETPLTPFPLPGVCPGATTVTWPSFGGCNGIPCNDGDTIYMASITSDAFDYFVDGLKLNPPCSFTADPELVTTTVISAIDPATGNIKWQKNFSGSSVSPLTVANGVLYATIALGGDDNNALVGPRLLALNTDNGDVLFSYFEQYTPGYQVNFRNTAFAGASIYKGMLFWPNGGNVQASDEYYLRAFGLRNGN